jgi:uncharacterized protein
LPTATESNQSAIIEPNSLEALRARVADGRISWTGPLLLVTARSILLIASQALVALCLYLGHWQSPWREAGHYWNVYGTLVDIGCLIGLVYFTRREGIGLRDLFRPIRLRHGRDVLVGLGYFLLVFPLFVIGGILAHKLIYGAATTDAGSYLGQPHYIPTWALIYSLSLWWLIWSPTEEATYQAYVLPRLQALSGRTWVAFLVVGFLWTGQHTALSFIPDLRFIAFRFLAFLPGVLAMMVIYWRTRRLAPLIMAHWPMDIIGSLMMSVR